MAVCSDTSKDAFSALKTSYFEYKLGISKKTIHLIVLVLCIFNTVLLIPDLALNDGSAADFSIVVLRALFSIILLSLFFTMKSIRTFKTFSLIVTVCELFALFIFLYVLGRYSSPNFLIQTMGIITLIIIIFLIPNRWSHTVFVSVFGAIAFLVCSAVFIDSISPLIFTAAAVYITIDLFLCAIFAWSNEKHQFREFSVKKELERISFIDHLTLIPNRLKLEEEADRWIDFCHRHNFPLALVFIDVDGLKGINDQYGHLVGDSVLANLAKLIVSHSRGEDIIARWGGDEFVLLLPCIAFENAIAYSERIRKSVEENVFVKETSVTCSFGVVEMKEGSVFNDLVHEADMLMYEAKNFDRNNVCWDKSR